MISISREFILTAIPKDSDHSFNYSFSFGFDDLDVAMAAFNDYMHDIQSPDGKYTYVCINIGVCGSLIEYDETKGLHLFTDVEAGVVTRALDDMDRNG